MSPNEFEAKVKAAGPWGYLGVAIRNHKGYCPLGAAIGFGALAPNVPEAAVLLGIPYGAADRIACAADFLEARERPKLLALCGLTP